MKKELETRQTPQMQEYQKAINELANNDFNDVSFLSSDTIETLKKIVALDEMKNAMQRKVNIAKINYENEKRIFLDTTSKTQSKQTRRAYFNAFLKLETFCKNKNMSVLELTSQTADDFIFDLRKNYSPATVRLTTATASSLFSFLERRHNNNKIIIQNVFRGTKARPQKKTVRQFAIPTESEVETIIKNTPQEISTMLFCVEKRGFRAGAFPQMKIHGERFSTVTKGKEQKGTLPSECIARIKKLANSDTSKPFCKWNANNIERMTHYYTEKLYKQGKIQNVYSVHDFRHFYAVTEYKKDKDIYRISKLLNHSNIQTTENYLKGLNVIE